MNNRNPDVLIVGAGPIGLSMAIQLKSYGFNNFRIIDKGPEPGEEIVKSISRAIGIHARTVELFEDLGIAEKLIDRGTIAHTASNFYNSKLTYRVDYPSGCKSAHVRYPWNLMVTQGNTIDVLHKHLKNNLNVTVDWNKGLSSLVQNEKGVTAVVINNQTGEQETINARYLVGCDGCHSNVRRNLGFDFPGHAYPVKWVVCDLDIDWDIPHDDITFLSIKDAYAIALPLAGGGKGRFRVTMAKPLTDADKAKPTGHAEPMEDEFFTGEDCVNFFKKIYPSAKVNSTPSKPQKWFQVHCRFVEKFRDKNCFLIGDAAHVHSPILGQGMNMGIQDATNLAWKLASVCQGYSDESLLDSFEEERLDADKEVVYFVDKITKLVITRSKIFQYLRGFILSRVLKTSKGREKLIGKVMQLSINYKNSASTLVENRWNITDKKYPGVKSGMRIPDPLFTNDYGNQVRLFDTITGNRWNALIFIGEKSDLNEAKKAIKSAQMINDNFGNFVNVYIVSNQESHGKNIPSINQIVDKEYILHKTFGANCGCIYLLRPDRYVGYRESGFLSVFDYLAKIYPNAQLLENNEVVSYG